MHTTKRLTAYGHHNDGLFDIADIKLRAGFSIVADEELLRLRSDGNSPEITALLALCRKALTTPDGRILSKKAGRAVYAIDQFMGKEES